MKFATMSQQDKMKASGLIGLIVVVLFIVVHTMLGALAPKPQAAPAQNPDAPAAPALPPPATAGTAPAPGNPMDNPWPGVKQGEPAQTKKSASSQIALDVHDPFVPLDKPRAETRDARYPAPDVHLGVAQPGQDFRVAGSGQGEQYGKLPPMAGGAGAGPGLTSEKPATPAEPEIKLVGVVQGDESIATLNVNGRIVIARPGDPLPSGYKLTAVEAEGIKLRRGSESVFIRTGSGLNETGKQ